MEMRDEDIEHALLLIEQQTAYEIPETEQIKKTLEFSDTFYRKRVWRYERRFFYLKKKAYYKVAVIFFLILALSMVSGTAYAVYRIYQEYRNDRNTDIRTSDEGMRTSIEQVYQLSKLPEGYVLMEQISNPDSVFSVFINNENKLLHFNQLAGSSEHSLDNEDTMQEYVTIRNAQEAIYYEKHDLGILVMYKDGYTFILMADQLTRAEMLQLAESISGEGHS